MKLLAGGFPVIHETRELSGPPEEAERHENHTDRYVCAYVHNFTFFGGRGGIRTPEGCYTLTVFKTAAIDHSATLPVPFLAGREGIEPPTNGFGDRYSTN